MWFLLILVRLFKSNNKIYYFINQYITSKPNPFLSYIKDTQKSALAQLFYDRFRLFRLNNSILSSHREVIRNNGQGCVQIAFSPFI